MTKEQLSELRKACTDSPSMDGFEISANDILWLIDQVENKQLNAFKAGISRATANAMMVIGHNTFINPNECRPWCVACAVRNSNEKVSDQLTVDDI